MEELYSLLTTNAKYKFTLNHYVQEDAYIIEQLKEVEFDEWVVVYAWYKHTLIEAALTMGIEYERENAK